MSEPLEAALPPFVAKTYRLINDPQVAPFATWTDDGKGFTVFNPAEFAANVLPKYFKHSNFCSFVRQLNIYGFHKVHPEQWTFKHENEYFVRGDESKLKLITRRKQSKRVAAESVHNESEMEQLNPKKAQHLNFPIEQGNSTQLLASQKLTQENEALATKLLTIVEELVKERLLNEKRFEALEKIISQLIASNDKLSKDVAYLHNLMKIHGLEKPDATPLPTEQTPELSTQASPLPPLSSTTSSTPPSTPASLPSLAMTTGDSISQNTASLPQNSFFGLASLDDPNNFQKDSFASLQPPSEQQLSLLSGGTLLSDSDTNYVLEF
jgi:hypothetical protein